MDLLSLELVNFGTYKKEFISFEGLHIVGLFGPNGTGKTTLTEAISWILFGRGPKSGRKNDSDCYVNDDADECEGILVFELNGLIYKVCRTWNKKSRKGQLNLFYEDNNEWIPIGSNKRNVQNEINKILNMDYKTFVASVFAPQGQSDSLTSENLDDMEKKEILSTILGLDFWSDLLKKAQEKSKERQKEFNLLVSKIDPLKNLIEKKNIIQENLEFKNKALEEKEKSLEKMEKEISEFEKYFSTVEKEKEIQERLEKEKNIKIIDFESNQKEILSEKESLGKETNELAKKITEIVNKVNDLQDIINRKEEIEDGYSKYESLNEELEKLDKKLEEYNMVFQKLAVKEKEEAEWQAKQEGILNELQVKLKTNQETAFLLNKVNCSGEMKNTCPLLQNARVAEKNLADLQEQYALFQAFKSPHADKILDLKEKLSKIEYDSLEHKKKKEELKELERYIELKTKLNSALIEREHLNRNLADYKNKISSNKEKVESLETKLNNLKSSHQEEIDTLEKEIEKINQKLVQYDDNLRSLNIKKEEVTTLKSEIDSLREEIGALKQQQEQIKNAEEELINYREKYEMLEEEIKVLKIIEKAAHKKSGVPLFIIENAKPQIEYLTNDLLERITDGRFSITIETQIEAKTTDNIQEVFRIFVYDSGKLRPYHQFSGAEKFIIDTSVRVGVCKFLAQRSGTAIKIFIMDEGLSSLDDKNRSRILKAIFEIGKEFNKLLIITHVTELQSMLSQRMYFTKSSKGTKITVIK